MIGCVARLLGMTSLLLTAFAIPAHADGELGLSRDGINWANSFSEPLFDSDLRWVPGDSKTVTFYARNQGGTEGDLTVDLLGSRFGNLIDSGDLYVTATGGNGSWATVSEPRTHRLLTTAKIPSHKVVPINVKVVFRVSSPAATQLRTSDLNLRVTLSESRSASPSHGSGAEDKETGSSDLPNAGAPELRWYAAIGAMLVGVGLAFATRRRERDEVAADV